MKMQTAFSQMENLDGRGRSALVDRFSETTIQDFLDAYDEGEVEQTTGVGKQTMKQLGAYVPMLRELAQKGAEGVEAPGEGQQPDEPQADATGSPADDQDDQPQQDAGEPTAEQLAEQMEQDKAKAEAVAAAEQDAAQADPRMYSVQLKPHAKYHAGGITVIYGGTTHLITKGAALIVRGEKMMEAVAKACQREKVPMDQLKVHPVSESELHAAPQAKVISSIDVAQAGRK